MHAAKDPISNAVKESLIEKLGGTLEVRQVLQITPLAIEAVLYSAARGEFRARIYHVKEGDFESFREAWQSHRQLVVDVTHPQLKPTLELEQLGSALALTGEVIPGLSLDTYCEYTGPMAPTFATRLLLKIINLYNALYDAGGHHLNLRLENTYIDKQGNIILSNFGLWNFEIELADLWGQKELQAPHFLSPEHILGKTLTVSSEIYQLGVLYYRLVTGTFPYDGEYEDIRDHHLNHSPPNPQNTRKDLSIGLARILTRTLAKKPNERFWTLEDLQTTLSLLLPLEERHSYAETEGEEIPEADLSHYSVQLAKAREQFNGEQFEDALHTVGAVLMVAGHYEPAIDLAREIREKSQHVATQKLWEDARYVLDMGQPEGALDPLHQILDLNPNHKSTLELQSQLFEVLEGQPRALGKVLPVQAFMEQAGVAKTLQDYALAESLWYMVLLSPSPTQSADYEIMQMQKKVARQELETLHALSNSGSSSHIPQPNPDASTFRDEELEKLFAPISPDDQEPEAHGLEEDALFDDLASSLDESHIDLGDGLDDALVDDPMVEHAPTTALMPEISIPEPTRAMPHLPDDFPADLGGPATPVEPPEMIQATQRMPILGADFAPPEVASAPPQIPTPTPPPPAPALPPAPPPTASTPPPPKEVPVQKDAPEKKSRSLIPIIAGVAALIVIAVAFFIIQKMNKDKAFRKAADQAYLNAEQLEDDGQWDDALVAWRKAETDFPKYMDIPERAKTLEYKIKDRKANVAGYLTQARDYLDQGILFGNGTANAVAYLQQTLGLEPENEQAIAMMDELADSEMEKIRQLFSEEKVTEAQSLYKQLVEADRSFADPNFEADVNAYLEQKVIGPQLAKIETAIKRKRWDQALELSDSLRDTMNHPETLNNLWNQAFSDIEQKLEAAEAKGNKSGMLTQINLLARIRPDDIALVNRRNELNREINQGKIETLENSVQKALKAKSYVKAGNAARQLERLDSENGLAKSALDEIRNFYLRRIREERNSNPRAAHSHYKNLVKVFNWKTYRNEMNSLGKRIATFDGNIAALKNGGTEDYDAQIARAVKISEQYNDFRQDPNYGSIDQAKDGLIAEKSRYAVMVDWEKSASNNPSKTYQSIVDHLSKAGPFKTTYGKKQKQNLMAKYRNLIENYQGAVTLVIRSAKNLPKEKKGLNKAPEGFCELSVGGQTFTTGVVNNSTNPTWDYTCNFNAKPGQVLTFTAYDSERGNKRETLGSITLSKLPKSTRGLVLKNNQGWSITIDVRRER